MIWIFLNRFLPGQFLSPFFGELGEVTVSWKLFMVPGVRYWALKDHVFRSSASGLLSLCSSFHKFLAGCHLLWAFSHFPLFSTPRTMVNICWYLMLVCSLLFLHSYVAQPLCIVFCWCLFIKKWELSRERIYPTSFFRMHASYLWVITTVLCGSWQSHTTGRPALGLFHTYSHQSCQTMLPADILSTHSVTAWCDDEVYPSLCLLLLM